MPRNGSGVYSLPSGSLIANGETSDATDLNTPLEDLQADANTARPIVAGGTGATNAADARTNLGVALSDFAGIIGPTDVTLATPVDFTGIPSGVVRVDVMFRAVSLSGTDAVLVQLGDSGGIEGTDYIANAEITGGGTPASFTNGFRILTSGGTGTLHGAMRLTALDAGSQSWACSYVLRSSDGTVSRGGGTKVLSAELSQLRVTRAASDTFDLGEISVRWSKV